VHARHRVVCGVWIYSAYTLDLTVVAKLDNVDMFPNLLFLMLLTALKEGGGASRRVRLWMD